MATFLAQALDGLFDPVEAGRAAAAAPAERIPDGEARFAAVEASAGGFRALAEVATPGATKILRPEPTGDGSDTR